MKCLSALIFCLAFSMILLSCNKGKEVTVSEPQATYTILGSVQYWGNNKAVAGVKVGLSSLNKSETCITDSTGSYLFEVIGDVHYTIFPIETEEIDCYFSPESREVIVRDKDITLISFIASKYPKVILQNNSPKIITGVRISPYSKTQTWSDNLLSTDLAPFSGSERIHIKAGNKIMEVTWVENTVQSADWVSIDNVLPGDSLVFPLNSLIKVENRSSETLVSVVIGRHFTFPGSILGFNSGNLLRTLLVPGSVSEDIYCWPGQSDVKLTYLENADSINVILENVDISPGDTVYIPFEISENTF